MNEIHHAAAALARYRAGDVQGAASSCEVALDADPNRAGALDFLGAIRRQQGRREEALQLAKRAAAAKPDSSLFLFNLGDCYRALGRLEEAIDAYTRSLRLAEMPQTFRALGIAYARLGRFDDAICAFQRSIQLQPEAIAAYKHLLACLIKTRRWSEAGELCRKAAAIAPMDPTFHAAMGDLHLRARSPAKAAECFRKAVRLQPGKARTLVGLAVALNRLGKWPEAAGQN